MATLLSIAWRNLLRGWRRSAIVLSALTVGLIACLVVVAWSHGWIRQMVESAVSTRLPLLSVHALGYQANPAVEHTLGDGGRALADAVERFPGAAASPRALGDGLAESARKSARVMLIGVEPAREARVSSVAASFLEGGFPEPTPAGVRALPGVAIGESLAQSLSVRLGAKLVLRTPGESGLGAFRVSGIFRTAVQGFDKSTAFLRLEDAQRMLGLGDGVHEVAVALADPAALPALVAFARAELPRVRPDESLEILTWRERERRLAAMLDLMESTAWITYALVFAGMAFGIANALLMSVYERIREFGVLRSLGLPAHQLVLLVLLESLVLTLGGSALGVVLGVGVVWLLGRVGIDLSSFTEGLSQFGVGSTVRPELGARDLVSPFGLAFATALLAAVWPAWKAARLRPSEALRHV